jgi:hypothetical protein
MIERWKREGWVTDNNKVIMLDLDLVDYIKDTIYGGRRVDTLERPGTIRKLAKNEGWFIGDHRVSPGMKTWGVSAAGARVITNDKDFANMTPAELGGKRLNGEMKKPLKFDWAKEM